MSALRRGQDILITAAARGSVRMVAALLQAGADTRATDGAGRSAYDLALASQNPAVVAEFKKRGAAPRANSIPGDLLVAAESGDVAGVSACLSAGVDVNVSLPLISARADTPRGGQTALGTAAMHGRLDAVRALLDAGADINLGMHTGWCLGRSPLMWAAYHGHADVVKELVARGADLNAVDKDRSGEAEGGWTALHYAAREGRHEVARILLEAGVDAARKCRKKTPADLAAASGYPEIAAMLSPKKDSVRKRKR